MESPQAAWSRTAADLTSPGFATLSPNRFPNCCRPLVSKPQASRGREGSSHGAIANQSVNLSQGGTVVPAKTCDERIFSIYETVQRALVSTGSRIRRAEC